MDHMLHDSDCMACPEQTDVQRQKGDQWLSRAGGMRKPGRGVTVKGCGVALEITKMFKIDSGDGYSNIKYSIQYIKYSKSHRIVHFKWVCMVCSLILNKAVKKKSWEFPGVQWLGLQASTAGGMGSIPGWGTKTLHVTWPKTNKAKCKQVEGWVPTNKWNVLLP